MDQARNWLARGSSIGGDGGNGSRRRQTHPAARLASHLSIWAAQLLISYPEGPLQAAAGERS
jgi:hypothetical protein